MNERLQYLFDRYMRGNITPTEERELMELALLTENEPELLSLMDRQWDNPKGNRALDDVTSDKILERLLKNQTSRPLFLLWWKRVAVAASIILVLGLGVYFGFFNAGNKDEKPSTEISKTNDVEPPQTNRAMITLIDGSTVYLDSTGDGPLAMQGNIKLVKLANGKISYEATSPQPLSEGEGLRYNTLSNPRGSKVIDMVLADGSHVWLNAGSSVTYPVVFAGNERKIAITGEAYFEVSGDKSRPFKVSKGDMTVEVLGTHFNVNAYDDEKDIKVTLLEGSVRISRDQKVLRIKPGQQALVTVDNITLNNNPGLEAVMAWKNGRFEFVDTDIEQVMREISRWYDLEVIYEAIPGNAIVAGGISRSADVSKVLKILETSEAIRFRIEGKKVYVIK